MKDLTNPAWIKGKGLLFLFLGLLSGTLLFLERPTPRVAVLLILAVWSFCRFYYFAFYVLERYVDRGYGNSVPLMQASFQSSVESFKASVFSARAANTLFSLRNRLKKTT